MCVIWHVKIICRLAFVQGTFGASFGLRKAEECTLCGAGQYCDGYGLTEFRGLSSPGFYCLQGCNTSTPHATHAYEVGVGDVCPAGHYCPQGTGLPIPCPAGTYNERTGGTAPNSCSSCSPGQYCAGLGNVVPTGMCRAGYYCPPGSTSATENDAPPGTFTKANASAPSSCLPGYYNPMYAQSSCLACPSGYYCPDSAMTTYEDTLCPIGNYCPAQSQHPSRCPIGTFSNDVGLSMQSQCVQCTPGSYCGSSGLHQVSGPCDAGFFCTLGAQLSTHASVTDSMGGVCPTGHYCPVNTAYPIECPAGTYMSSTGNTGNIFYNGIQIYCNLCTAGRACTITGLSGPGNTLCNEGYWCKRGSPFTQPSCDGSANCLSNYGVCPVGHYCPLGTDDPIPCADGTYMDETGAAVCKVCPAGRKCSSAVRTDLYQDCPQVFSDAIR
jgi:hypothetical protein